jgi:hypothetical protein
MSDENTTGYSSSSTDTSTRSSAAAAAAAQASDKPAPVTGWVGDREVYLDDDVVWRFKD